MGGSNAPEQITLPFLSAMGQNNPDFQALKEALADFELLFAELKQTEESTYETEESTYE